MAEATAERREMLEKYGIAGPIAVAIALGVVYYLVHEVFHILLGFGFVTDTIGSIALGAVAAAGVLLLGRNARSAVAAFILLFAAHSLVMGHGGLFLIDNFGGSMPVAVVAAIVFFVAAGGLEE